MNIDTAKQHNLTAMAAAPGAGYKFPAQEVSWLQRDVLLFAKSIGATADELHFLYVCSPTAQPCRGF